MTQSKQEIIDDTKAKLHLPEGMTRSLIGGWRHQLPKAHKRMNRSTNVCHHPFTRPLTRRIIGYRKSTRHTEIDCQLVYHTGFPWPVPHHYRSRRSLFRSALIPLTIRSYRTLDLSLVGYTSNRNRAQNLPSPSSILLFLAVGFLQ